MSRAAHPLPEERDSADLTDQAEALLAESDERTAEAEHGPGVTAEHRTSDETAT